MVEIGLRSRLGAACVGFHINGRVDSWYEALAVLE